MADEHDDLMQAALATQEEEEKASKAVEDEETVEESQEDAPVEEPESEPEEEEESDAPEQEEESEETEEDSSESTEDSEDEPKQTRKERRAERKKFLDSIKKDNTNPNRPAPQTEEYSPLDYSDTTGFSDEEGFLKPDILKDDREKYAKAQADKAAQNERVRADQEKFWDSVALEGKILSSDPEFAFLKEDSPDFDPDLTADINERFLALVGHQEVPLRDPNTGQALIDPQTGQPAVSHVVSRTDLSYEKFARAEMDRLKRFTEAKAAKTVKNLAAQRSRSGVRPTGSSRRGPKINTPQDIKNMSPEEFAKHEKEIMKRAEDYAQYLG